MKYFINDIDLYHTYIYWLTISSKNELNIQKKWVKINKWQNDISDSHFEYTINIFQFLIYFNINIISFCTFTPRAANARKRWLVASFFLCFFFGRASGEGEGCFYDLATIRPGPTRPFHTRGFQFLVWSY